MQSIILPINPYYSKKIISGEKKFEMRRRIPKNNVNKIFLYETSPTCKIVALVDVKKTHKLPLKDLWNLTKKQNSLSKKFFYEYYSTLKIGYAYEIKKVRKLKVSLEEFGIFYPPQGFVYVETSRKNLNKI